MNDIHQLTLTHLIDRIVPADDWPSASENNVAAFILKLLDHERREQREWVVSGLQALDAESVAQFEKPFALAGAASQDLLLADVEKGRTQTAWAVPAAQWFELMVNITHEGYYADRSNGANPEHASWRMVGYDPRRTL